MQSLPQLPAIYIRQRREAAEFFGFETRNKYEVLGPNSEPLGFAAEQGKGFFGQIVRQFVGHWRTFEILLFDNQRQPIYRVNHPFRFFFQRLEISDNMGRPIGIIQQRFAFLFKRFDILTPDGRLLFATSSAPWKIWTFPITRGNREVAVIRKKWSGILSEAFTDKDNFQLSFADPTLKQNERILMLAAAIFIDLQYFEKKANSR